MKNLRIFWILVGWLWLTAGLLAQTPTQTLRGRVIDQESQQPLVGATVIVFKGEQQIAGANTDTAGYYQVTGLPLGGISIEVTYLGYGEYRKDNLYLTAAREEVQNVEMVEQGLTTEGATITYQTTPNAPVNRMQIGSTRSLSPELTKKAAGAIDDPSRLVMGFPGVQAPQDNNSDLVIRGNSPVGLLWRLEGVDIPNPNHFARIGSSGGGVTIFSAQLLGESDFSTGAWSAEYGNAFSGVFDVHFRRGNNQNFNGRSRVSLLGIDVAAEGPFKKGRGSYLVNYRYSTLGILNDLGFRLVNERVDNTFQDLSFNLYFPLKNDKTFLTWFGIGGLSEELWDTKPDSLAWSTDFRTTTDFLTDMGATGVTLMHQIDSRSYFKAVVAISGSRVQDNDDTLDVRSLSLDPFMPNDPALADSLPASPWDIEDYRDWRISSHAFYNRKLGKLGSFRAGVMANHINFSFEQFRQLDPSSPNLEPLVSGAGSSQLLQGYSQFSLRPGARWTINPGVHAMYFVLNGTYAVDPRLAMKYQLSPRQSTYLSYGLHSAVLPLGNYFTEVDGNLVNQDLDMIRSHHLVGGYDLVLGKSGGYHLQVEAYVQRLVNVPVSPSTDSSFWILNNRQGYATQNLVSEGTGLNYGLDLTFEKFFRNGGFFLISGSLYNSQYSTLYERAEANGGDTLFNTRFNGNYNLSAMGSKEWEVGDRGAIFQISTRLMINGGLRYTPGDPVRSLQQGYKIEPAALAFSERLGTYFRVDGKASLRFNTERGRTWRVYAEAQNLTNRLNPRDEIWDEGRAALIIRTQSGLIPNVGVQVDF